MEFIWITVGLLLLLGGGEALVRGSVLLASRMGVSQLVIGLTLVGFGTSTPELVASLQAALLGSSGVAVGNIVGSNIANILLILGLSALIYPVKVERHSLIRDGGVLILVSIAMLVVVMSGALSRMAGIALLLGLIAYTGYSFYAERKRHQAAQAASDAPKEPAGGNVWLEILMSVGGIAGVIIGADLLVDHAIVLARDWGVSETLIGLTLVAVGTSLPELVTSVMAAIRKHSDVALGNIIGSNIFNILGIAGVTAVVVPISVPEQIAVFDIWAMLGAAALLVLFAYTGARICRLEAVVLCAGYIAYLACQLAFFS